MKIGKIAIIAEHRMDKQFLKFSNFWNFDSFSHGKNFEKSSIFQVVKFLKIFNFSIVETSEI